MVDSCPVCLEDKEVTVLSTVCSHFVCTDCFSRLMKCPICRLNYIDVPTGIYPGLHPVVFGGTNEMPTTNLFDGRLWFNVETNELNVYLIDRWLTEDAYCENDAHYEAENIKTCRLLRSGTDEEMGFNTYANCKICGIQRTVESNNYLMHDYMEIADGECHRVVEGKAYTNDYCWGTNAFDGGGIDYCLSCYTTNDRICSQIRLY